MTTSLISRLEAATGPDRDIDRGIQMLVAQEKHGDPMWGIGHYDSAPAYTGSLDAAMTLVPKSAAWTIEPDAAWIRVSDFDDVDEFQAVLLHRGGTCTAIALVIAALKARGIGSGE